MISRKFTNMISTMLAATLIAGTVGASPGWFTATLELGGGYIEEDAIALANLSAASSSYEFANGGLGSGLLELVSGNRPEPLQLGSGSALELRNYLDMEEFESARAVLGRDAPAWTRQTDEDALNGFGFSVYRLTYTFNYINNAANAAALLDAYVRFIPRFESDYANEIIQGLFGLHALHVRQGNRLTEVPRLYTLSDPQGAYYCPFILSPGNNTITLEYTLLLGDNYRDTLNQLDATIFENLFEFELVQVYNNASILEWHVIMTSDAAKVAFGSQGVGLPYHAFSLPEAEGEAEEEDENSLEADSGDDAENNGNIGGDDADGDDADGDSSAIVGDTDSNDGVGAGRIIGERSTKGGGESINDDTAASDAADESNDLGSDYIGE